MIEDALSTAAGWSDDALLAQVGALAGRERDVTARLVAALAELDVRRLYLGAGCSSLFTYCTQVLHFSEHAAYARIEAARAARRFPIILNMLADGALHLTAVGLLSGHLTAENYLTLLAAAKHKSKRQVEEIVARLRPQPPVPSSVRKLPQPGLPAAPRVGARPPGAEEPSARREAVMPTAAAEAPRRVQEIRPLAPQQFKVQFTVSRETYYKLRRAQDLLRHAIPNGDVAMLFDRALTLLVSAAEKNKFAATDRPRATGAAPSSTRYIPAAVRRAVWARDGGRCAFAGNAVRCNEAGFLEFHHKVPHADGGPATADNLELRCRAHNGYEADRWFGRVESETEAANV